ncbi:MAG TPA: hypothetical protein VGS58_01805 [Candidatus Sulfopaludibacter sp.]|nr:hypothetical protein [Candidatus Sulfopaludibacter sp.]
MKSFVVMGQARLAGVALVLALRTAAQAQAPAAGSASPEALRDYTAYLRVMESRMDAAVQERDGFLWANTPERRAQVRAAGVLCEPRNARGDVRVTKGLIHDWVGSSFIPGAAMEQVLAPIQDYDHHKNSYRPVVIDSRTLEHQGNDYKVRLRLVKRKIIRVVVDVDSEVHYRPLANGDWQSRAHGTRIVEIADAGGPNERALPPSDDHGFLWRLDTYWLFRQRDGGVYVECEAVSLSRAIPAALAWLIEPIVRSLPKDELVQTLTSTRALVLGKLPKR